MDLDITTYLLKIQKSFQKEISFLKAQTNDITDKLSYKKAVEEKIAYYPIHYYKTQYSTFGNRVLTFNKHQSNPAFNEGTPIALYHSDFTQPIEGVVETQDVHRIHIVLPQYYDGLPSGSFALLLRMDERQIEMMQNQMSKVLDEGHSLRKKLLNFKEETIQNSTNKNLNDAQEKAWNNAVQSASNCIIHGPPGTGKSQTLTAITQKLVKQGKKVLIATPSNQACDHLAQKILEQGIDLVRIGHTNKVNNELIKHTPYNLFEESSAYQRIESYKKQIQQLEKAVQKFHRNFTQEDRKQRQENRKEIKQIKKEIAAERQHFFDTIINEKQVVCGTLIGIEKEIIQDTVFDVCIIDEAGQATTPALLVPIEKAERFILAGDPLQLPPTVMHNEKADLKETLLEFYYKSEVPTHFLDTQYRMDGSIMDLINQIFYNNQLKSGKTDSEIDQNITFIDTAGTGFEEAKSENESTYNIGEVKTIKALVDTEKLIDPVIITPYSAQVEQFEKEIPEIPAASVDSFQGSESETVIFSCVRSNENGEIGFLKDYRRLNVALSRAKSRLIIIGDSVTLSQDKVFDEMIGFIEGSGGYKSAFEFDVV